MVRCVFDQDQLKGFVSFFLRADPVNISDVVHKYFAITDFAGMCRLQNHFNNLVQPVISYYNLQPGSMYKACIKFSPSISLDSGMFRSNSFHFGVGHETDSDKDER